MRAIASLASAILVAATIIGCGENQAESVANALEGEATPTVAPLAKPAANYAPPLTVEQLLPGDGSKLDHMSLVYPKELAEIKAKRSAALRENSKWFQEAQRAAGRKSVPYDPRLGITREEYDMLLHADERMVLEKNHEHLIHISRTGSRLEFDTAGHLAELERIGIDLATNVVTIPDGQMHFDGPVQPSSAQTLPGPWEGFSWSLNSNDPEKHSSFKAKLFIGRITESGRGWIGFRKEFDSPAGLHRFTQDLMYNLPE